MVFRKMRFGWVQFHIEISKVTRPNFTGLVAPNAGGIAVEQVTPILNIFIPSGDIRRQTLNSTEIGQNFACFWLLKIFLGGTPKISDRDYKIELIFERHAKFRGDRPTELGDYARGINKNKFQQNISPPPKKKLSFPGRLKNNNKFQQNISPPEYYRFRAD